MIKKIVFGIVAVVAAILLFAATRPADFRIERSARIAAPPEELFAMISNLRRWRDWSPWENIDPDMQRAYSGAPLGKGAVYAWEGNGDVGSGRMEIVEVDPARRVKIQLDFIAPMEAHNTAEFALQPEGDTTNVTWAMYGRNNLVGKLFGLFMDMDAMVGDAFETGLANLKKLAES